MVTRVEAGTRRHPTSAGVAARTTEVAARKVGFATRTVGIVARTVGAICGGYAIAASAAAAAAVWLPLPRAEATLAGMLASFVVFAGAFLWCFAARSARRAWAGLALMLAALLMLLALPSAATVWWGR